MDDFDRGLIIGMTKNPIVTPQYVKSEPTGMCTEQLDVSVVATPYIYNTSTGYIDAGVSADKDLIFEFKCKCGANSGACVIGGYNGAVDSADNHDLRFFPYSNNAYFDRGSARTIVSWSLNTTTTWYWGKGVIKKDGTQVATYSNSNSISSGTVGIFRASSSDTITNNFYLWYLKIWDGNENLLRSFIPQKQNGVAGLWDEVTQAFYQSTNGTIYYDADYSYEVNI